ncbi:MAG: lysophospholipid acyltransferase family protein [Candidatus Binatia bacterium]
MRWLKLSALLSVWFFFFVFTGLIHLVVSVFRLPRRWRLVSRLSNYLAILLRGLLNIKIVLEGDRDGLRTGGHFIVSNHLGYVDGIVLGSIFPAIYVSKREVRRWPWIGQWTALTGTIFVDRQRKEKILQVVEEIAAKLNQKANVLVFPEGTSTNGERLLPFQSAFFAAPLVARAVVVPVTLTYRRINQQPLSEANRDRVYWYGGMDFISHVWGLLGLQCIEVSVKIHPKIETSHYINNSLSRKQLSQACYDSISGEVNFREESDRRNDSRLQRVS